MRRSARNEASGHRQAFRFLIFANAGSRTGAELSTWTAAARAARTAAGRGARGRLSAVVKK